MIGKKADEDLVLIKNKQTTAMNHSVNFTLAVEATDEKQEKQQKSNSLWLILALFALLRSNVFIIYI